MSNLIDLLRSATGLSEMDLRTIIRNAPSRYRSFTIPKRDGTRRPIAQPAKEVKALQCAIVDQVLSFLPVHSTAAAYRKGLSIKDNAQTHAGNGPILKMDFENFFPSIRPIDWKKYCDLFTVFTSEEDQSLSQNILFHKAVGERMCLAIGAPSSPCLSNVLMFDFDERISTRVGQDSVRYTRYADDLTFSARRTGYLNAVQKTVAQVINEIDWPKLKIKPKKTVLATRKYKRVVTGLILTNDGRVSLGHERKKRIHAAVYRAKTCSLSSADIMQLAGMIAFAHDVEPDFVLRLEEKYGSEFLRSLKYVKKPTWPNATDGTLF